MITSRIVSEVPDEYVDWFRKTYGYLISEEHKETGRAIPPALSALYIPPRIITRRGQQLSIENLMTDHDRLLIGGMAGSGKTSLLKYIACTWVSGKEQVLPLLISLKDLKIFLNERKDILNTLTVEDIIKWHINKKTEKTLAIHTVRHFLRIGRIVFLLDGLDKLLSTQRDLVLNLFLDYLSTHKGNKLIVTCRGKGIEMNLVKRFEKYVDIDFFNEKQINEFIDRWHIWNYSVSYENSRDNVKILNEKIRKCKNPNDLIKIMGTPLIMTILCIFFPEGREPGRRAALYKEVIDNLLFDDPSVINDEILKKVDAAIEKLGLQKYDEILKKADAAIKKDEWEKADKNFITEVIKDRYRMGLDETPEEFRVRTEKITRSIHSRQDILKIENGRFNYYYLIFQQYMTGVSPDYKEEITGDYQKPDVPDWNYEWYREDIEAYINNFSREQKNTASIIIEYSQNTIKVKSINQWVTAFHALLDLLPESRFDSINKKVVKGMFSKLQKEHLPEVSDSWEMLGWLGDKRDVKPFIKITNRLYQLEEIGEVVIEPFEIGKYPVTNSWFEEFIQADGYEKGEFWSPEGLQWIKQRKIKEPMFWGIRKWRCPNSPVVGVSWYEAYAFTRWLSLELNDGYNYRLLNEKEWQAAAAGAKIRRFPWGEESDKQRCNNGETGINKISPVGIFKKGNTPEGIADMGGNVWEWTVTDYRSKQALADFQFDNGLEEIYKKATKTGEIGNYWLFLDKREQNTPVLRGGSWATGIDSIRCVVRHTFHPDFRTDSIGFRCARTKKCK